MQELTDILGKGTAGIAAEYFQLSVDGGDPIYRERVYCYELYHQVRCLWPAKTTFRLNGEVDKRAHPILAERGITEKPDLLVHTPGHMKGNYAVIEVKTPAAGGGGIKKDLRTLSAFINKAEYQRAIYLIYGMEADNSVLKRIIGAAAKVEDLASIEIWFHSKVGAPAELVERIAAGRSTNAGVEWH